MNIRKIQIVHPGRQVDNLDLFKNEIPDIEKFVVSTGIRYRYVAPEHHKTEDYFVQGIRSVIENVQEIDVLITVTQTPSKLVPSVSNYLNKQFRFREDILTYDLISGCSGYTEALVLADYFFKTTPVEKILICNGDFSNHIVQQENYTIRPLFSDVVAVTLLERNDEAAFFSNAKSFPDGYSAINSEEGWMNMNGLEVFQFSTQYVADSVRQLLEKGKKSISETDGFYFHQANLIINKTLTRQLQLPEEKVPLSIHEFGNSSSASIPLTLALNNKQAAGKQCLLLSGFGVGFKICNVLAETATFESNISAFEDR